MQSEEICHFEKKKLLYHPDKLQKEMEDLALLLCSPPSIFIDSLSPPPSQPNSKSIDNKYPAREREGRGSAVAVTLRGDEKLGPMGLASTKKKATKL